MFFPILLDLKKVTVFGAGKVALRKVGLFQSYDKDIQIIVISEAFDPEFNNLDIRKIQTRISPADILQFLRDNPSLVISALDSRELNERVAKECHNRKIPVNVVDNAEISSVIFPAVLRDRDLVISISTLSKCPFYAREIKKDLFQYIKKYSQVLEILSEIRNLCMNSRVSVRDTLNAILKDRKFQNSIKEKNFEQAHHRAQEISSERIKLTNSKRF